MRIGDKSIVSNDAFVSFRYTSKYAKNANILLTSNGNESYNKNLKGADAKKHEFSWSLPMLGSNYFKLTVNKGTETEYKKNYPINMVCGEEFTYPSDISSSTNKENEAVKDNTKLLISVGADNVNGGCNMAVTVEDPEARNVYIKINDENRKVVGTASTVDEVDAMNFRRTFSPEKGGTYTVTATVNKGMHSEKSVSKTVYADCSKDKIINRKTNITPEEAALMADHIYDYKKYNLVEKEIVKQTDWKLVDVIKGRETVIIGVYERGIEDRPYTDPLEYAIVNKGTTIPRSFNMDQIMESAINWQNNFEQMLSPKSADMWDSIEKAKSLSNIYQDTPMTFVGHSKGGAESAIMAITANKNAILFNPASPNFTDYGIGAKEMVAYTGRIDTYIVTGEALDYLYSLIGKERIGNVHFLPMQYYSDTDISQNNFKLYASLLNNHGMNAVKSGLGCE